MGDAFVACRRITTLPPRLTTEKIDPCRPSPCGSNANCRNRNGAAACTCIQGYFGDPYIACRPECSTNAECPTNKACQNFKCVDPCPGLCGVNAECKVNSDCASDRACINRKCQDPCPGLCGVNAYCRVRNHIPICVCNKGYSGDPFSQCQRVTTPRPAPEIIDPCNPSPCGINAECREQNNAAACVCLPGLQGDPYTECKPECTINQECASNLACIANKCKDPCPGVCGTHATCSVRNHNPSCTCDPGYFGDPFRICTFRTTQPMRTEVIDPCNPSPCGSNANCQRRNNAAACQCIPEYFGDPYVACRPECVVNSDCPSNKACQRNKCIDPCPGTCG